MAEYALSYVLTLVVIANVCVVLGLVAIVAFVPRTTRRRAAHRAETAPVRARLSLVPSRSTSAKSAPLTAARAA